MTGRSQRFLRRLDTIGYSILSALFIFLLSYFIDSTPYPIGSEVNAEQWMERMGRLLKLRQDNVPDSVCLINVTYDKTLLDYDGRLYADTDSLLHPAGQIAVTDRSKLLRFLTIADSLKSYRYILLDVRFSDDIVTDSVTKKLFDLMRGMDRLVFAMHEDSEVAEEAPIEKGAYGDYHTTFLVTDVVKYPVFKHGRPSIPAKMYEDLADGRFTTWGWFTFFNGRLCRRAICPSLPVRLNSWAIPSETTGWPILQYHNLGENILLQENCEENIARLIDDQIVVIGDFIDDVHDTYIGPQPGAIVNLNSYIALCRGDHFVGWWEMPLQLLLFGFLTWCIIRHVSFVDFFPALQKPSHAVLRLIVSLIGYSVILATASALIYLFGGTIFNVAVPSLYFSILESCVKRYN